MNQGCGGRHPCRQLDDPWHTRHGCRTHRPARMRAATVQGPNSRQILEIFPFHEPQRRAGVSPAGQRGSRSQRAARVPLKLLMNRRAELPLSPAAEQRRPAGFMAATRVNSLEVFPPHEPAVGTPTFLSATTLPSFNCLTAQQEAFRSSSGPNHQSARAQAGFLHRVMPRPAGAPVSVGAAGKTRRRH